MTDTNMTPTFLDLVGVVAHEGDSVVLHDDFRFFVQGVSWMGAVPVSRVVPEVRVRAVPVQGPALLAVGERVAQRVNLVPLAEVPGGVDVGRGVPQNPGLLVLVVPDVANVRVVTVSADSVDVSQPVNPVPPGNVPTALDATRGVRQNPPLLVPVVPDVPNVPAVATNDFPEDSQCPVPTLVRT